MTTDQMTTLVSLAILKVDLDEGFRDYLDYLYSFTIYVLKKYSPDPVTDNKICELLLAEFGLKLPLRGCQMVLRRIARRGFLSKENNIYTVSKELPHSNLDEKREKAQAQISSVYMGLISYANSKHNLVWSEADVSKTLFAFLSKFGVDYLRAFVFNTALPVVPKTVPKEQFVISLFIRGLYDKNDPLFQSFVVLVKGHMYSNALLCPDLESIEKKFNKTTFYIDTPLLLNYLGVQGQEERMLAVELFQLIRNLRGKISVFEHTLDETKSVLLAAEKNIDNAEAVGRVVREMRRSNLKRSDIILLREKLDEHLKYNEISISRTPIYKKELQISETELEEKIRSKVEYRNPEALKYDINSVRSIYVLRRDSIPRRLEDANAILVSTNAQFAEAAFEFGQSHNSTKEVSSVITDYSLANVAWLKAPLGAPDLPTKGLIAACFAAMEPTNPLWRKYFEEIEKQRNQLSSDDHALLRLSPVAADELMYLTKGDEQALTGSSIRVILDRVKAELVKDKTAAIEREREKRAMIATKLEDLRRKDDAISANIYWLSEKITRFIMVAIKIAFLPLLFFAALICSSVVKLPILQTSFLSMLGYSLLFIGVIWGFLNWWYGLNFNELISTIEKRVNTKVHTILSGKIYRRDLTTT